MNEKCHARFHGCPCAYDLGHDGKHACLHGIPFKFPDIEPAHELVKEEA